MEKAFSIFMFIEGQSITQIGYVTYDNLEDDLSLKETMTQNILSDNARAILIPFAKPIHYDDYFAALRVGMQGKFYEAIFSREMVSYDPLVLVTPIIDGIPKFDLIRDHSNFSYDELIHHKIVDYSGPPDYLKSYMTNGNFDLPRLIDDDYLKAFKLLLNNGYYVSAAKLLFSCIDSISFIEFGDKPNVNSFKKWIDTYALLSNHGITAEELWEMRNGYLHMTSTNSRKVNNGEHPAIILYVGRIDESRIPQVNGLKYLNIHSFYKTICSALHKWIISYSQTPEKFQDFVKRYDLTVSDTRLAKSNLQGQD